MKLAILHSGDLQKVSPGGVDRYVKSIIQGFGDDSVTLFGTTNRSSTMVLGETYKAFYGGISYTFVPISYDDKTPLCVYYARNLFKYMDCFKDFDCIYAQRIEYSLPFAFSPLKHRLIQLIHGSSAYSEIGFGKGIARVYPWFEKKAIGVASRTYVVLNRDEFGVPYYKRLYPKYSSKIFYGRNPIDCSFFERSNRERSRNRFEIPNGKFVVAFVGRVSDNPKRVLLLPNICQRMIEMGSDVMFLVVGDGPDSDTLKKKVEALALGSSFRFIGYISDSELIRDYIAASDVSINISCFEGTCTSVLESLACGVPVLSTDVGDIHEVLNGGQNGTVIPNDEDSLVKNASNALLAMSLSRPTMGTQYRKYDLPIVVEALSKDISELKRGSIGDDSKLR